MKDFCSGFDWVKTLVSPETSKSQIFTVSTPSVKDYEQLHRENSKISKLEVDNSQLLDALQKKESLFSSFWVVASEQSEQIAYFKANMQDTVVWDPFHLSLYFLQL